LRILTFLKGKIKMKKGKWIYPPLVGPKRSKKPKRSAAFLKLLSAIIASLGVIFGIVPDCDGAVKMGRKK